MRLLSTKKEDKLKHDTIDAFVSIDMARFHFDRYLVRKGYGDTLFDELPAELKEIKYELHKAYKYVDKLYREI